MDVTQETIVQDKAKIESLPIANIRAWRDKKIAHIEKDLVLRNVDIMIEPFGRKPPFFYTVLKSKTLQSHCSIG